MTADERRRAILEALCSRRHDTRENLAFEFGVSKRTIEYDVLRLSLDYPIFTTQGNGGGIHVVDGFRLDKPCLTDKQSELLNRLLPTLTGNDRQTMLEILKTYSFNRRNEK